MTLQNKIKTSCYRCVFECSLKCLRSKKQRWNNKVILHFWKTDNKARFSHGKSFPKRLLSGCLLVTLIAAFVNWRTWTNCKKPTVLISIYFLKTLCRNLRLTNLIFRNSSKITFLQKKFLKVVYVIFIFLFKSNKFWNLNSRSKWHCGNRYAKVRHTGCKTVS